MDSIEDIASIFEDRGLEIIKQKRRDEKVRKITEIDLEVQDDPILISIQSIEGEMKTTVTPEDLQSLTQKLNVINDRANIRIGVVNDLFISLFYPASSCKELVENIISRIGHRELREEAEMHLSVITRLVEKLNRLVERLDIEKLKSDDERKIENVGKTDRDSANFIKTLINNLSEDELKNITKILKSLTKDAQVELGSENSKKKEFEKDFYVLSDEAQVAVGIITEIEQRRILAEKLVRWDRRRQSFTATLVTFYIGAVIFSTIYSYIMFGSNPAFVVGNDLNTTKLAFFGIPWPIALWSLIGSFAAMIYRFNRQPIYNFTEAVKWMLTRPVQGLVLGSAFYLVLTSGLFLLTGGNSINTSSGAGKVTTEILLILSFLVGFSDRFADSVFNTLVDRYSRDSTRKEKEIDSDEDKKSK